MFSSLSLSNLWWYLVTTGSWWSGWYAPPGVEDLQNASHPHTLKNAVVTCGKPPRVPCQCTQAAGPCLLNLDEDPCEYVNLASKNPEVVDNMLNWLEKYKQTMVKPRTFPMILRRTPRTLTACGHHGEAKSQLKCQGCQRSAEPWITMHVFTLLSLLGRLFESGLSLAKARFIRSWKVTKSHGIWKCIFQAGKVIYFRKNSPGHGKVVDFHFWVKMFHAVWKLETLVLSSSKNMPQNVLGCRHFLDTKNLS